MGKAIDTEIIVLVQFVDTTIIGAGHNGLICAAYPARSGQYLLTLEAAGDTLIKKETTSQ
jgi:predicted flavoprotein YhiN